MGLNETGGFVKSIKATAVKGDSREKHIDVFPQGKGKFYGIVVYVICLKHKKAFPAHILYGVLSLVICLIIDERDKLIIRAITLYCKAEFGYNGKAENFRQSYDLLKYSE